MDPPYVPMELFNTTINNYKQQHQDLSNEVNMLKEQIQFLEGMITTQDQKIKEYEAAVATKQVDVEDFRGKIINMQKMIQEAQVDRDKKFEALFKELNDLQKKYVLKEEELEATGNEIVVLDNTLGDTDKISASIEARKNKFRDLMLQVADLFEE